MGCSEARSRRPRGLLSPWRRLHAIAVYIICGRASCGSEAGAAGPEGPPCDAFERSKRAYAGQQSQGAAPGHAWGPWMSRGAGRLRAPRQKSLLEVCVWSLVRLLPRRSVGKQGSCSGGSRWQKVAERGQIEETWVSLSRWGYAAGSVCQDKYAVHTQNSLL